MKNRILVFLLGVAVSAFVMGATAVRYLDTRYVRIDEGPPRWRSDRRNVIRSGDVQICWGTATAVATPNDPNAKTCSVQFEESFIEKPNVTLGVHTDNRYGNAKPLSFAPYTHDISTNAYSCSLIASYFVNETMTKEQLQGAAVRIDYIAVGRWR
jgi:hypothetical protein